MAPCQASNKGDVQENLFMLKMFSRRLFGNKFRFEKIYVCRSSFACVLIVYLAKKPVRTYNFPN